MHRRRRVTSRFYIFLLLLLVIAFLILRPYLFSSGKVAAIMTATAQYSQMMDCVIIRDETVIGSESITRVEYTAAENTLVNEGDTIAYVYTSGYSEGLLAKLEETRRTIQEYHKNNILNNIKDPDLERYDTIVNMMVLEFKKMVNGESSGSMLTVAQQLEASMVNRQEYLRQNKREDTKLAKYYDDEHTRLSSIQSWRKEEKAAASGVISFYTDGYEKDLSGETISTLTVQDIRTVLSGGRLSKASSVKNTDIYRLVDQNHWYVAVIADTSSWNPVVGWDYYLQIEGFEDMAFSAVVTSVQKENNSLLAVFEINDPLGALIYQRTGRAMISTTLQGLSVTAEAICVENGQTGVLLYDIPGGTFVPVEVLSNDGKNAMIRPLAENAIGVGDRVLIK